MRRIRDRDGLRGMLAGSTTQSDGVQPFTAAGPLPDDGRAAHLEILYRLTDRLYRAADLKSVLSVGMDAITEGLGCEKCSILLFDPQGVMRFVAWRGLSDHYRRTLEGHTPWSRETVDPPPIFVPDIAATQESDQVKKTILAENIRSLGFIPLTAQGRVIGKFMVYHPEVRGCTQAQKTLAVTIARQLGFSIERVQAEAARRAALNDLVESEQRFRLMAEHAPVMIWMCDAEGRCLHLNLMLRRFWNVADDEIEHLRLAPFHASRGCRTCHDRMGTALTRQENVTVTGRYRNAAGEYRTLETLAHPRFGADGTFMGLTGVNTDITDRERAEKALRDSEERFRTVVEASPAGMVMTDGAGRILMVNAPCEKLFGYERGELLDREIEVLVPPRSGSSTRPSGRSMYRFNHPTC